MIKRIFDVVVALILTISFLPLILLVSIILYCLNDGKIFFKHTRPGLKAKPFTLYKFKTMSDERGVDGELLPNHMRISRFGNFLRNSSLDELPQLINVLKGDISLVGPRPLEMRYLPLYNEYQNQRHQVKPGITGLAQIGGRNSINWDQKFDLDVEYVKSNTFLLDLFILGKTVSKVLRMKDVNQTKSMTVIPFDQYLRNKNDIQ